MLRIVVPCVRVYIYIYIIYNISHQTKQESRIFTSGREKTKEQFCAVAVKRLARSSPERALLGYDRLNVDEKRMLSSLII
jgi:hypothetical protein